MKAYEACTALVIIQGRMANDPMWAKENGKEKEVPKLAALCSISKGWVVSQFEAP
ncbi:MAG: hypothetical protein WCD20_12005 [Rhodomicrobium sp.]